MMIPVWLIIMVAALTSTVNAQPKVTLPSAYPPIFIVGNNVGIGTTSPPSILALQTNIALAPSALTLGGLNWANNVRLTRTSGTDAYFSHNYNEFTGTVDTGSYGTSAFGLHNGYLTLETGTGAPTERMRITAAGNVGIGTTSPTYLLSAEKSSPGQYIAGFNNTNATTGNVLQLESAGVGSGTTLLSVNSGGTNRFSILGNGNVGIGTTSPAAPLTVKGRLQFQGTTPTVGTGGSDCGTSPAIVGYAGAFRVTVGTTPGAACTVTFNTAWTNNPVCQVTNETSAVLIRAIPTSASVTKLTGTLTAGDVLAASCTAYE